MPFLSPLSNHLTSDDSVRSVGCMQMGNWANNMYSVQFLHSKKSGIIPNTAVLYIYVGIEIYMAQVSFSQHNPNNADVWATFSSSYLTWLVGHCLSHRHQFLLLQLGQPCLLQLALSLRMKVP